MVKPPVVPFKQIFITEVMSGNFEPIFVLLRNVIPNKERKAFLQFLTGGHNQNSADIENSQNGNITDTNKSL